MTKQTTSYKLSPLQLPEIEWAIQDTKEVWKGQSKVKPHPLSPMPPAGVQFPYIQGSKLILSKFPEYNESLAISIGVYWANRMGNPNEVKMSPAGKKIEPPQARSLLGSLTLMADKIYEVAMEGIKQRGEENVESEA